MAEIEISEITGIDTDADGLGIFDKLMSAVERRIEDQYDKNRITGREYAEVYLGSVQAAMSEAIKFTLGKQEADKRAELLAQQIISETKNNEDGGVIDLQKEKLKEEIDVAVAKSAEIYESILASQANTLREDEMNSKQIEKVEEEIDLLQSRDLEQIAATVRADNESTKRQALMEAQTIGFRSDTKTKVLRLFTDGYSAGLSIAGVGVLPDAYGDNTIDGLADNLLTEIGASGLIVPRTPDPTP